MACLLKKAIDWTDMGTEYGIGLHLISIRAQNKFFISLLYLILIFYFSAKKYI